MVSAADSDPIQRSWRLTFALCAVVFASIVATAVLTERSLSRLSEARSVATHALLVDKALKDLMNQMLDAESGQRGFLLSGRTIYLQPYYVALTQLRESRAALALALGGEPTAAIQLDLLDKAIAAKLQELDRIVRMKSEGRPDDAAAVTLTEVDKQTMDAVRAAVHALATGEDGRANKWEDDHALEIRNNYWIFVASLALNLLLYVGLVLRLRYAAALGHNARQVMEARNDDLSRLLDLAAARNEQVHGLSELSRFLQSCVGMDEAVLLLQQQLPILMKASSGALYIMAASRDQLCRAFTWGGEPYAEYFEPGDCWAVRLGQPFRQPTESGAAACAHLASEHPRVQEDIRCLPLVAHGELLGLLVLDAGISGDPRVNVENEGYRRITIEQVGLSIGNLKLRESLRQQSIRDPLTGLYNRRFLEESAQREVLRASRLQAQNKSDGMAMMMIDIDHFKRFNDEHGHEIGDQVLCAVADALQRHARGSDVAARYGGEEFTIVLADMPAPQALERAEQVRQEVEKLELRASNKDLGKITISIGLAQFPTHGGTVEELLLAADKALYEAKRDGRNRVVVATQEVKQLPAAGTPAE
jgi:diguanylate cyclase (GGDEF)-like protein